MGSQATKIVRKGVDYVTGTSYENGNPSNSTCAQSALSLKGTPFVLTRTSSMYFDEDGHTAHEFYRETRGSGGKIKLKRITKGLRKKGEVKLKVPRLNVDFPIVIYEG